MMIKKEILKFYFIITKGFDPFSKVKLYSSIYNNRSLLKEFITSQKKKLFEHIKKIKYYKKILNNYDNITYKNFIKRFPILTKEIIRNNFNNLIFQNFNKFYIKNSSGGSTGEPIILYQDYYYIQSNMSTWYFYLKEILNIPDNAKSIKIWGAERDIFIGRKSFKQRIIDFLYNQKTINSFKMSEQDILNTVILINKYKPYYIHSYASSIYKIAQYIKKKKLNVNSPKLIITSAETLYDFMREEIESVFGTIVYDFYGSREVGAIAGEIKKNKYLVFNFHNLVEIDKNNNILVTNLHNEIMPLIKYKLGDKIKILKKDKNLDVTIIKKIEGRISDCFVTKKGEIIHGEYFTHLFYFRKWVDEFQIIQEDFEKLKIYIVKSEFFNNEIFLRDKNEIENKIKLVLGENTKIEWEFVEKINKTKTGKHRYTISMINQ